MSRKISKPKRWTTPRVVRDWQQGETPLPTERNASKASEWIDEILGNLKLTGGVDEERIKASWKTVAGGFVASQTEVVSLKNGVLTLRVLQPAMRFHLEQSRGELLAKIQDEVGKKQVRTLKLTVG